MVAVPRSPLVDRSPGADEDLRAARHTLGWLTLGSLIPLLGWLYGVLRLWASPVWAPREKVIGTLCFPFGVLGALWAIAVVGLFSLRVCGWGGAGCVDTGPISPWAAWAALGAILAATGFGPIWLALHPKPKRAT